MHAFDILGDPARRRILELLADGEQTYAVEPAPLSEVGAWLDRFRRLWEQRLDALGTEMRTKPIHQRREHDMKDILEELAAAHRAMGKGSVPAGDAYTIEVRRRYEAQIEDVWDAVTSPERLHRWLKPVTGDLRLGGKFELDGGEHGEILQCEPPRLLKVSWLYGPDADAWPGTSEVEVRLAPGPTGDTEFELIHAAVVEEPLFPTYGPGAGGVGWDLALLALARLLADGETADHEGVQKSPEQREFIRRSAAAWGKAHLAAGGEPEHVTAAVEATTRFYAPDPT